MFQTQFDLVKNNTLASEVTAAYFYAFSSEEDLLAALDQCPAHLEHFILGGGSNIVFTSHVDALVLHNVMQGIEVIAEDGGDVLVRVAGGVEWHGLVQWSIQRGYSGIENLSLIPGTVGAAPIQNIGAYGVELCDVFESLEAIEVGTGRRVRFSKGQCEFSYRHSVFKTPAFAGRWVIVSVTLKLCTPHSKYWPGFKTGYGEISSELSRRSITQLTPQIMSDLIVSIRRRKLPDPSVIPNSGSFFKNPIVTDKEYHRIKHQFSGVISYPQSRGGHKLAAGWMIDQLGWKGREINGAKVHNNQALVLINTGGGGKAVVELSKKIQVDVMEAFGVHLEPEPLIVG